ncbi:MAG: T9SS type A sorting domain-containing protein, partial [Thermoplasmatales archaeon]|nr:T9SS type A sorting domain-containing protein [Thermoplasmatales archaeon]
YIEALTSVSSAEDIYTMDMTNNSSPFEGSVCGLRYLGTGYKTVFFGYPLYFMDQDQARLVAQKVMGDFGEVYIEEKPIEMIHVSELRLYQNRPNPFRNKTDITFSIGQGAKSIDLKIYDVTGRLVRQFDHTTIRLSDHISWDGNDDAGRVLPNGVYFYQLNVDDQSIIKKLIMLR